VNSGEAFVYAERNQAERAFEQIIGNSPALESALEPVERVAPTDSTALIQGEMESRAKRAPSADNPKESIYESVPVNRRRP
jgi:transcriptional regulator of aromatic amino acid metabolism